MKTHKREIDGKKVEAYNDSDVEWVVSVEGEETVHWFKKKDWTMKDAMQFAARLTQPR